MDVRAPAAILQSQVLRVVPRWPDVEPVQDQAAALKWLPVILAAKLQGVQAVQAVDLAAVPKWPHAIHVLVVLVLVQAVALRWLVAIHVQLLAVHALQAVALKLHHADAARSLCSDC